MAGNGNRILTILKSPPNSPHYGGDGGATYTIYEKELYITSCSRGKRCNRVNACNFIENE